MMIRGIQAAFLVFCETALVAGFFLVNQAFSLAHRSVEINPLAAHLDIGFVDAPGSTSRSTKAVPALDELWRIPPRTQRRMVVWARSGPRSAIISTIAEAELVAQVPTHANDDHLAIEVPPCKHHQSMIVPALMIHYALLWPSK